MPRRGVSVDGLDTQGGAAVLDRPADGAQPAAQPEDGGSGSEPTPAERNTVVNDLFRSAAGRPALKPFEAAPDGGSAPEASGDEKPAGPERGTDGKFVPRRAVPEMIRTAEDAVRAADAEIADLKRQLDERDPEKLRQQWAADEQTRAAERAQQAVTEQERADVARYERLKDTPDADLSAEDYQWREDRKALLAAFPQADALYRAQYEQRLAQERGQLQQRDTEFWSGVRGQILQAASTFGVDPEKWKQSGVTWLDMTADAVMAREDAVRTELGARISELENELRQYRFNGAGGIAAHRAPMGAGRSGGGALQTGNDRMNSIFRSASA